MKAWEVHKRTASKVAFTSEDNDEKALDCRDAIEQLKETESELYEQAFEHISTMFDGIVGQLEHFRNMMEGYVDQTETAGYIVSSYNYSPQGEYQYH